jgi:2',3'-cyclic-nucleotide 2'-phosphodiesterase (5'-nucleotidase family)
MLKTINFHFHPGVTRFCLAGWLLAVCVPGLVAQQSSAARPAQSPAPATGSSKSGSVQSSGQADVRSKTSQAVVDSSLPDDPALNKMLGPYTVKVRALDVVIGKLEGELRKGGLGGGTLGNFVTDGMRAQASKKLGAPIDLVVSNSGGLRKSAISPGDLRIRDIFELLPFENALVELELTGEQLRKVLEIAVQNREPQAGARVKYRTNAEKKLELASAVLVSAAGKERQIDPRAIYRVITIDYLLNVEGGKFAILHEARVKKPLGVMIRDAMIEYVKDEAAAGRPIVAKFDGRFRREGTGPVEEPPQ